MGPGSGHIFAERSPCVLLSPGVHPHEGTPCGFFHFGRRLRHCPAGPPASAPPAWAQGSSPAASLPGHSDAPGRGLFVSDRPNPPASTAPDHRDLCQSRFDHPACRRPTLARRCAMSPLNRHLKEYLALRRRLGFKLRDAGYELHKFVRFAQEAKASFITTKLARCCAEMVCGDQMYGVVVVTSVKPRRSRIGRLSPEASTSMKEKQP